MCQFDHQSLFIIFCNTFYATGLSLYIPPENIKPEVLKFSGCRIRSVAWHHTTLVWSFDVTSQWKLSLNLYPTRLATIRPPPITSISNSSIQPHFGYKYFATLSSLAICFHFYTTNIQRGRAWYISTWCSLP